MTAKQLALRDMASCGIKTSYLLKEKEILDYLNQDSENSGKTHPDFRKFNKKSNEELYLV